jgi:hypothetical protein
MASVRLSVHLSISVSILGPVWRSITLSLSRTVSDLPCISCPSVYLCVRPFICPSGLTVSHTPLSDDLCTFPASARRICPVRPLRLRSAKRSVAVPSWLAVWSAPRSFPFLFFFCSHFSPSFSFASLFVLCLFFPVCVLFLALLRFLIFAIKTRFPHFSEESSFFSPPSETASPLLTPSINHVRKAQCCLFLFLFLFSILSHD